MTEANPAPKILAVDTSSLTGSAALCSGERLIAESLLNVRSTHSEKLLQQIDLLLEAAGWRLTDLDLLVAVTGPGSFTGLRIGVATVKGLAQVLERPVIGISSLQMLAMNLPLCPVPICVFLDARKKEVYTQLYRWTDEGPVAVSQAQVLPPAAVLQQLQGEVALVGDAVPLYQELIAELPADRVQLPAMPAHQPRASQAAWLAWKAFLAGKRQHAAELLPVYIRPSDAELNQGKK